MIVRPATPADAGQVARLLNQIIAFGGTTAHQTALTDADLLTHFIDGPDVRCAVVAEDMGRIIGWQSVGLWRDEDHIGPFVMPVVQAQGVGARMFGLTLDLARAAGLPNTMTSVRADNVPGLAYYARIGFVDVGFDPAFALEGGQVVGRVHRRFDVV